jgi:hypothetical protein
MSKWPTIDEMLKTPISQTQPDPFFHMQQLPRFMRRKVILPETYDKQKNNTKYNTVQSFHTRKVSEKSPYQKLFQPYGRVLERVKSIYEKVSTLKELEIYDEAVNNQEHFTKVSPKDPNFQGEFKSSSCPRESPTKIQTNKQKPKKNKSYNKIGHKISTNVDEKLNELVKSNVLALLSRNSFKKCPECKASKCECVIVDEHIPVNYYENIKKGKELIEQIKYEKKTKNKVSVSKPDELSFSKKSRLAGVLRQSLVTSKFKDPNTLEGVSIRLSNKYRRHSS